MPLPDRTRIEALEREVERLKQLVKRAAFDWQRETERIDEMTKRLDEIDSRIPRDETPVGPGG